MRNAIIREATTHDIEPVAELFKQWAEEDSAYGFQPDEPALLQKAIGPYFLVAEIEGTVVGFIIAAVFISEGMAVIPDGASYVEIENLYVVPSFRNQGTGSNLVTQLLHSAKAHGVTHSLLYSSMKDIHQIIKFYEKHHFKSWYVQMFQEL